MSPSQPIFKLVFTQITSMKEGSEKREGPDLGIFIGLLLEGWNGSESLIIEVEFMKLCEASAFTCMEVSLGSEFS